MKIGVMGSRKEEIRVDFSLKGYSNHVTLVAHWPGGEANLLCLVINKDGLIDLQLYDKQNSRFFALNGDDGKISIDLGTD